MVLLKLTGGGIGGIALVTISISPSPGGHRCHHILSAHTSAIPLIRRRSLGGNCITSVFNLCSAASPETGLDTIEGLSFADTQLATPWSGRSLVRFQIIAHTKLLCRCSVFGSAPMI